MILHTEELFKAWLRHNSIDTSARPTQNTIWARVTKWTVELEKENGWRTDATGQKCSTSGNRATWKLRSNENSITLYWSASSARNTSWHCSLMFVLLGWFSSAMEVKLTNSVTATLKLYPHDSQSRKCFFFNLICCRRQGRCDEPMRLFRGDERRRFETRTLSARCQHNIPARP